MMHLKNLQSKKTHVFIFSSSSSRTFFHPLIPIRRRFSSHIQKDSILIPPTKTHLYASFFCTLIRLYLTCGKFCIASDTFYRMRALSLVPSLPLWNDLLYEFNASGFVSQAKVLYSEMVLCGLCLMFLVGFCKRGLADQGFGLLSEMVKKGVCFDSVTCNILAKGYCRIGLVQYAEWIMGNLVGGGVPLDVVGLNTLVDGYCEAGMMSRALDLVEDGRKNGVEPDIVTYNTLVNGFCMRGDLAKAESVVNEILGFGRDGESGLLNECRVETRDGIRDLQPTVVTWTTLIAAYCKHRGIDDSFSLYEQMIMSGIMPDVVTCSSILYGLCRHGKLAEAAMLLREMHNMGLDPNHVSYTTIISVGLQV
ncbi:hypothetical protein JHK85_037379 [Glycine max]|nr:hypothetical protein JHK85_037379 [Glycine max]